MTYNQIYKIVKVINRSDMFDYDGYSIKANKRKLKAIWTVDLAEDLAAYHLMSGSKV